MLQLLLLLADDPPITQTPAAPGSPLGGLEPVILMALVFFGLWLFVLRPASRQKEQERLSLLNNLKKNDKVLTIAGVYGVVVSVSETEDEVVVKVDDNCRMKMQKGSIARNLTNEEAAKAAKETKPADVSSAANKA
jgi:preprotein translocase subunit YajC